MIARDKAFAKFMHKFESQPVRVSDKMHAGMRVAFNEGWDMRKQAELEAVLGIKHSSHSTAHKPLTPFRWRSILGRS